MISISTRTFRSEKWQTFHNRYGEITLVYHAPNRRYWISVEAGQVIQAYATTPNHNSIRIPHRMVFALWLSARDAGRLIEK